MLHSKSLELTHLASLKLHFKIYEEIDFMLCTLSTKERSSTKLWEVVGNIYYLDCGYGMKGV